MMILSSQWFELMFQLFVPHSYFLYHSRMSG